MAPRTNEALASYTRKIRAIPQLARVGPLGDDATVGDDCREGNHLAAALAPAGALIQEVNRDLRARGDLLRREVHHLAGIDVPKALHGLGR